MKILAPHQLTDFFSTLTNSFEVRLPVVLPDGTRTIGSLADGPISLLGGSVLAKPTAAFFPHDEPVFSTTNGAVKPDTEAALPLFVAGLTHRDKECLRFIDRFFAEGWRDDIYFRRRMGAVIAGVSGHCGPGGTFLPLVGRGCDLEFVWNGECWLVAPYSETGLEIAAGISDSIADTEIDRLKEDSLTYVHEGDTIIRRASDLLRDDKVPDSFWEEIGDHCIACTGCNLACPTCTCFGVQDWRYGKDVERSRMWDSCQLDGFMRESSGHNPLGTEALRTRRRIHHKLAADPQRWGEISCFLCGRCDAVCPTGIGILAVAREIVNRFESP